MEFTLVKLWSTGGRRLNSIQSSAWGLQAIIAHHVTRIFFIFLIHQSGAKCFWKIEACICAVTHSNFDDSFAHV